MQEDIIITCDSCGMVDRNKTEAVKRLVELVEGLTKKNAALSTDLARLTEATQEMLKRSLAIEEEKRESLDRLRAAFTDLRR